MRGGGRDLRSLPSQRPPPQAELGLLRGAWALQSMWDALSAQAQHLPASLLRPIRSCGAWLPRSTEGAAEAQARLPPPIRSSQSPSWAPLSRPPARPPGDAAACAAPLKAAGSARFSVSTGCQNMQIRGPESSAKSSRRRGAAGASPDPLLVWLFPPGPPPRDPPCSRRPSLQPGRIVAHAWPAARPLGTSRGRHRSAPRFRPSPGRWARAEENPGAPPPRSLRRSSGRREGLAGGRAGGGNPSSPRKPRGSTGRPGPPTCLSSEPGAVQRRGGERACHPPPARLAVREFLPHVPGRWGPPTARGPGILSFSLSTLPLPPRSASLLP